MKYLDGKTMIYEAELFLNNEKCFFLFLIVVVFPPKLSAVSVCYISN